MKVILLQDVRGVGKKFEEKLVSDGYATNFLLPQKLATPLSHSSLARIAELKKQHEAKRVMEEKRLEEKEAKRMAKRLELEKFKSTRGRL